MSQFINTNTIPCEISQDQDTSFLNLNDLSNVNELYFETSHPATQDLFDVVDDYESDLESNHDEYDIDVDVEVKKKTHQILRLLKSLNFMWQKLINKTNLRLTF